MQCPRCSSNAPHIITIEVSPKSHDKWAIERCARCGYAGWEFNPIPFDDFDKDRTRRIKHGRGFWGADGKWYAGV